MRIIAILEMSAGNGIVGEMWKETKSFDENTPVGEIIDWATEPGKRYQSPFRGNLTITVDQATEK